MFSIRESFSRSLLFGKFEFSKRKVTHVIRLIVLSLLLLCVPVFAQAEEGGVDSDHKWSVSTGFGFGSSIGPECCTESGFNWQLGAQYRLMENVSVGGSMQVVPFTGGSVFTMGGDARYHLTQLESNSNQILSKLRPYVGLGMGLYHEGLDNDVSDNAFMFSMIAGLEYGLTEKISLTSDMRFNILGGLDTRDDHFFFTWQMVGARYHF